MAEFVYQDPFPLATDTTQYRLVTDQHGSVSNFNGHARRRRPSCNSKLYSAAGFVIFRGASPGNRLRSTSGY